MSLCQNPTYIKRMLMPCGQCMACRLRRKREWTHRIMLEASLHSQNCFATLTYSDEELPIDLSLDPRHLQLFWKRLRFRHGEGGRRLRYYSVGEYGTHTIRPHYHAIIFGHHACVFGTTQARRIIEFGRCCDPCHAIQRAWPHGNVFVGQVERASAAYVSGYVTKKLADDDDERYGGLHPEFSRMSKRPGIGARYIPEVASKLLELPQHVLDNIPDVPNALRHGGKPWPLGRYLTRLLRAQIGRPKEAPEGALAFKREEVRLLQEFASQSQGGLTFSQVYKSLCLEVNAPQFNKLMHRQNLRQKKGTL